MLKVNNEEAQNRLDVFLSHKLEEVSRTAIQRWIESGHVTVQGREEKSRHRVKEDDEICVIPPPPEVMDLLPESLPLSIVHEDETLVVVNKPAGMVVHPGAGNPRGTLANSLLYHFREISRHSTLRPGIVHRLDKNTSGLLLVAKNEQAHNFLALQFKRREVEKHYLALVYGRVKEKKGIIEVPLGRDPWIRTKISTRSRKGRHALTEYQMVRFWQDFSYLRVVLHTGRTHQIRVHLQYLGHPIVGDDTYGKRAHERLKDPTRVEAIRDLKRPFLHATFLSFVHPETKRRVFFKSPLPSELARFLLTLK